MGIGHLRVFIYITIWYSIRGVVDIDRNGRAAVSVHNVDMDMINGLEFRA